MYAFIIMKNSFKFLNMKYVSIKYSNVLPFFYLILKKQSATLLHLGYYLSISTNKSNHIFDVPTKIDNNTAYFKKKYSRLVN